MKLIPVLRRFVQPRFSGVLVLVAATLSASSFCAVPGVELSKQSLTIVLDPGHNPSQQGALGARGLYEVAYNDALSGQIATALKAAGFSVILTRTPAQEASLDGRVQIANTSHADLFLAIHHDSAQLRYLEKTEWYGLPAYRTVTPLAGYSVFVSRLNPQFRESARFAELLGQHMRQVGRPPSHHHAEKIQGENREVINADLGIYGFDDLIVLKKTTIPAVLMEVGVIVDPDDEKYIADKDHQTAIVRAIVTAVQEYCDLATAKAP